MFRLCERIDDRQTARDESMLHILGQEQRTSRLRRSRHNQRIPELKPVIDGQVRGGKRGARLRSRGSERVGEFEQDIPCLGGGRTTPPQHDEQFAQGLRRRHEADGARKLPDDIANLADLDLILGSSADTGEIDEDIAVETDASHS